MPHTFRRPRQPSPQAPRGLLLLPVLIAPLAAAQTLPQPAPPEADAVAAPAAAAPGAAEPRRDWELALGLNYRIQPDGSVRGLHELRLSPVIYLRWGRISLTNARGFVGRRSDDLIRGIGAELVRSERWRLNMNLRWDSGQRDDGSTLRTADLEKGTLRVRLSARYQFDGPWRLGANWSVDALGRGTGQFGAVNLGWEHRLDPRSTIGLGASVGVATATWMRANYGLDATQAGELGVAPYQPGGGLRDVGASALFRHEFSSDWQGIAGLSLSRLMGDAAASPLNIRRDSWAANAAIIRRF